MGRIYSRYILDGSSDRYWEGPNLFDRQTTRHVSNVNPKLGSKEFMVGVASDGGKKHGRLVLITDKFWASDPVTTQGMTADGSRVRADHVPDAAIVWPGNTELFVNSVCWMSGLEDLLARSARTQDVPRIDAMSVQSRSRLKWMLLLGMPAGILVCGLTVWRVRRRG